LKNVRSYIFAENKIATFPSALSILRNKITGMANDALTHNGTVINFDAIMATLDFVFSDKRSIYIIEQELRVLSPGKLSIMDYYGTVNRKLTLLINKTIMTYGRKKPITAEMNEEHRKTALRVFITGLNGQISDTIFSMNPPDLPNAMVIVQELESNNIRAHFANSFSTTQRKNSEPNSGGIAQTHFNHKPRQQNNNYNDQQKNNNLRFNHDNNQKKNTYGYYNQNKNNSWNQGRFNNNQQNQWNTYRQPQNKLEPMEVDESIQVQKRANNGYNQSYNKYQNNNYSQKKWDQIKKFETQNTQQGQAQNKRVPTGTVNQPANKILRKNTLIKRLKSNPNLKRVIKANLVWIYKS